MKTSSQIQLQNDEQYNKFEEIVASRVTEFTKQPLFRSNVNQDELWNAYLSGFPTYRQQHYNCNCCRSFIKQIGSLIQIDDAGFGINLWESRSNIPKFFLQSTINMAAVMYNAKAVGVFKTKEFELGRTSSNEMWTHLRGVNSSVYIDKLKTAYQYEAEKLEEYKMLSKGIHEYSTETFAEAVRLLTSGLLYRSEKAESIADWVYKLKLQLDNVRNINTRKVNLLWKAVAEAPSGFAHIRSTMISTLLEDIHNRESFNVIKRKWDEKLNPLQYQRPTAPISNTQIDNAEKLVEKLGLTDSFRRRFATQNDITAKLWYCSYQKQVDATFKGIFSGLKVKPISLSKDLPQITLTFEKFKRTVLHNCKQIEILIPSHGSFYGLTTAAVDTAPNLYQWNNPVSHYFYVNGSFASKWALIANTYEKVASIFYHPCNWHAQFEHKHIKNNVYFSIEKAKDKFNHGLAIFPENLRADLREIKRVVEKYSNNGKLEGVEEGNANGLCLTDTTQIRLRCVLNGSDAYSHYLIDRID